MSFLRRKRPTPSEYRNCAAVVVAARIIQDQNEVAETTALARRHQPDRNGRIIIAYRRRDTAFHVDCADCPGTCYYERELNTITYTIPTKCKNPDVPNEYKIGKSRNIEL